MKYSLMHCIEKLKHTLVGVTETTLNNDVRCYSFLNSIEIIKHWNVLPIELETKISLLINISIEITRSANCSFCLTEARDSTRP